MTKCEKIYDQVCDYGNMSWPRICPFSMENPVHFLCITAHFIMPHSEKFPISTVTQMGTVPCEASAALIGHSARQRS